MIISLGRQLPDASCDLTRGIGGPRHLPLFGLAPDGVYLASRSPDCWWALTPPLHPYPTPFASLLGSVFLRVPQSCPASFRGRGRPQGGVRFGSRGGLKLQVVPVGGCRLGFPLRGGCRCVGRYLSVALSSGFPPLGVTQRPALGSSDFPQGPLVPAITRPTDSGILSPRHAPVKERFPARWPLQGARSAPRPGASAAVSSPSSGSRAPDDPGLELPRDSSTCPRP